MLLSGMNSTWENGGLGSRHISLPLTYWDDRGQATQPLRILVSSSENEEMKLGGWSWTRRCLGLLWPWHLGLL